MQAVEDPHFATLAATSTSTSYINTDGLSAEDVEELKELEADLEGDVDHTNVLKKMRGSTKYAVTHTAVQNSAFFKQLHEFVQLNKPVQHAIASLSSDSAALSDATRMFLDLNKRMCMLEQSQFPNILTPDTVAS
jgi:hypothetical protein